MTSEEEAVRERFERVELELADLHEQLWPPEPEPEPQLEPWHVALRSQLGVHEVRGSGHHPVILEMIKTTSWWSWGRRADEVPWCSAALCWAFERAEIPHTRSMAARSWLKWGYPLSEPRLGCVVVLSRGAKGGHGGLFEGYARGTDHELLGGNQGDEVSIAGYPERRVLGYRWPWAPE